MAAAVTMPIMAIVMTSSIIVNADADARDGALVGIGEGDGVIDVT